MSAMVRAFLLSGAVSLLLAVALGAFGAHALKTRLPPERLAIYQTASQYHFYHALGLLLVAVLAFHLPGSAWLRWSGWLLIIGTVLFSGSLYLLAVSGVRWLGAITPVGGLAFIGAWLLLAVAALRR